MEPELDLDDSDESCVPGSSVPETEPELDLDDSDESCVPGPSVPYSCSSEQKLVQDETCFPLEERVKGCTQHQNPVTAVWNNVFIGNEEIARDRMRLKELGITHILNAAAVKKNLRVLLGVPWEIDLRETVHTGARYYRGMNITYCGLPTTHSSNISQYFLPAAKFIHKTKKNPENKVFIHCTEGVSYAPTLFLAYLMIHHYMTVEQAIDYLIQVRHIKPDIDFLKQLAILNEELMNNTATKYRRENNSWIYKQAAKILQKKPCRALVKKCARIKRKCTLSR
ncbi:dual specificity phosphatase 29-like [Siphateles boraxobius]|uniref:dual specificity phosphatase 29-like n=1 Tax=Siphateles boraxobius TaxID=180520 RepID=UPI0040638930